MRHVRSICCKLRQGLVSFRRFSSHETESCENSIEEKLDSLASSTRPLDVKYLNIRLWLIDPRLRKELFQLIQHSLNLLSSSSIRSSCRILIGR